MTRRKPRWGAVLDAPIPLSWTDEALPCRHCKLPTHWRTQRGAKTHPNCEKTLLELTPEAATAQMFMVAKILGATIMPAEPPPAPRQTIALKGGRCGWCDRQGIAITDDDYFHCYVHMWPPYRWPPPAQEVPA